jgi:adenylylsulfate kinase-like enzyme
MKLILLEGGPASGKNTLGEKLVEGFNIQGEKSVLLDHDTYIEELSPNWIWPNEEQKEKDLSIARVNLLHDINKYLAKQFVVLAIGGVWLTNDDVRKYTRKLVVKTPVYLFHLNTPLKMRKQREEQRGHSLLIDLEKDQKERDEILSWPGYVYHNTKTAETDAMNLMKLINERIGLIFL